MTIITEGELRLLAAESAIQVALTGLGDIRTRITTLEARCLENERRETASRWWSETRQAPPVDDHRGKERPVKPPPELVRCAAWETCDDPHCNGHKGLHSRRSVCVEPCHRGTICIPVPAQEPKLSEQWRCPAVNCYHHYGAAWCRHGKDHEWRHDCAEFCCCNTCQPVPASPEVAIPDVPTPVGTEAFRLEMASQAEFLSNAYGWVVRRMLGKPVPEADANVTHPERLAGVACAIRDAYDLARVGETQAARQKLEEIQW